MRTMSERGHNKPELIKSPQNDTFSHLRCARPVENGSENGAAERKRTVPFLRVQEKKNTTYYNANNVSIPSGVREGPSTIDGLFKNFKLGLIRSTTEKRKRAQQDAKKTAVKLHN